MGMMYQFYSTKLLPVVDTATALGDSTHRFTNAFFSGTVTSNLVASNSVSTVTLAVTQTSAAATLTSVPPTFTAYYGIVQTAMGKPTSWLPVVVAGVSYKIPLY